MLTWITLIPPRFSAGTTAVLAAGMSTMLILPFLVVLIKLVRRTSTTWEKKWKAPLIILVFAISIIGSSALISSSSFCSTCHIMRTATEGWKKGKHRNVDCLACHRREGFGGIAVSKLEDARMVAAAVTHRQTSGLDEPIKDEICLGCHAAIRSKTVVAGKIKVKHEDITKRGLGCVDCHPDAFHNKSSPSKAFIMEKCSACHDGKQVSSECYLCHFEQIDKTKKPDHNSGIDHGNRWRELHGVTRQGICTACHSAEACARCHVEMPHPEGWTLQHGPESSKNRASCSKCHIAETSCTSCHQLPMPHQAGWLKSHPASAKQTGDRICRNCHLENDCGSCHTRHKSLSQVKKVRDLGK